MTPTIHDLRAAMVQAAEAEALLLSLPDSVAYSVISAARYAAMSARREVLSLARAMPDADVAAALGVVRIERGRELVLGTAGRYVSWTVRTVGPDGAVRDVSQGLIDCSPPRRGSDMVQWRSVADAALIDSGARRAILRQSVDRRIQIPLDLDAARPWGDGCVVPLPDHRLLLPLEAE